MAAKLDDVKVGSVVRVTPQYQGGNVYAPDGNEGIYTVVGVLLPADFKLCQGVYCGDMMPPAGDWDLISHISRIEVL